jgi:predicted transcriptional regulator
VSDPVQLTEPQYAILRVVWARGEASVPEIWRALYPDRGLAQSTVATMVTRLERRGILARRSDDGRQFVYRAAVTEDEVRASMVGGLTDVLFGGDARALVSHLVEARRLRPDDLDEVRRLLADAPDDPADDSADDPPTAPGGRPAR